MLAIFHSSLRDIGVSIERGFSYRSPGNTHSWYNFDSTITTWCIEVFPSRVHLVHPFLVFETACGFSWLESDMLLDGMREDFRTEEKRVVTLCIFNQSSN